MTEGLLHVHSFWAYVVLGLLLIAVVNALIGMIKKRTFGTRDLRISLFTLIVAHLQLLLGIIMFFVSDKVLWFNSEVDTSSIMENSTSRLYNMEHPLTMIIAIILITIGFSRHKKKNKSSAKFKTIFIFYLLGLILALSRIPWKVWFGM